MAVYLNGVWLGVMVQAGMRVSSWGREEQAVAPLAGLTPLCWVVDLNNASVQIGGSNPPPPKAHSLAGHRTPS